MNKVEIESKIEYQEVIGEANTGSYYSIRFTRIKYKKVLRHILTLGNFKETVKMLSIRQK